MVAPHKSIRSIKHTFQFGYMPNDTFKFDGNRRLLHFSNSAQRWAERYFVNIAVVFQHLSLPIAEKVVTLHVVMC